MNNSNGVKDKVKKDVKKEEALARGYHQRESPGASHHQHNLKNFLTRWLESKKLFLAENAPLPQLDRGTDYESVRRGFESLTAHH